MGDLKNKKNDIQTRTSFHSSAKRCLYSQGNKGSNIISVYDRNSVHRVKPPPPATHKNTVIKGHNME